MRRSACVFSESQVAVRAQSSRQRDRKQGVDIDPVCRAGNSDQRDEKDGGDDQD
jgi:hypothetical protein